MALRFLVRFLPRRELSLASARALAHSVGVDIRNPKKTSYGALEVDVFVERRPDFELFLAALEPLAEVEFHRDLNEAPPYKSKERLIELAREYFNAERYWECHEALETVWRNVSGEEKRLVQGVILVSAAFVHHQKGEGDVALGVLERGYKQLEWKGRYHSIDVDALKGAVREILETGKFTAFKL